MSEKNPNFGEKLRPKDPGTSLVHYHGIVKRWRVYTSLAPNKQAAYLMDNAFVNDRALQQRADRAWEVKENDLLSDNGVQVLFEYLLKDEEGLRLVDVALQWVHFHQVVGKDAKMARTASESIPDYLDRVSHEMSIIKKTSPALAPSDVYAVLVSLIGLS